MIVKVPLQLDDDAIASLLEQIGIEEIVTRFHHNEVLDAIDPDDLFFYLKKNYSPEDFATVWAEV